MFLVTVHSAIMLGRALAVLRQKAGTEITAVAVAMSSSPYRSRAEEWYVQYSRRAVIVSISIVLVGTSGTWALVTWLSPTPLAKEEEGHIEQGELALCSIMTVVGLLLPLTRQLMLNGSPLQVEADTFYVSMGVGFLVWIVAMVVAGVVGSGNAPGIVSWAIALAMAGYFGYGRAVEAEYDELMAVKRSEPRRAEDASGLLGGRDEEDACSAHIDASTSLCLDCAVRPGCRC
ncbi:hypothetical protein HU200_016871 [Digitaria exilis]|uniref:Uncharacterized protein n=1 Tax=Digitaria exilis TaxID=1010633 RepID=A0A835KII3_9POAL|nr:hypothetical protein HU200_016871 [Digitaria exilis]